MAVSSSKPDAAKPPGGGASGAGATGGGAAKIHEGAPAWLVKGYVGGLVLVYLGERVIVTEQTVEMLLSALGIALLIFTTAIRFLPKFRTEGQRASVERLLGLLSVTGLVGVLLYFASTEAGLDALGGADLDRDTRETVESLLRISWITLVSASVIPMLFAEAALNPMRRSEHLESRRVRAAAASGFALALAVVYCSLFVYAAGETEAQADYSYFKTSEPGSSTKKMIAAFDEPLKITAFFPDVSDVRSEVAGYLGELTRDVPNVELAVVDRYLEPKLAQDMKVFSDGTIVFSKGETKRTLTIGSEMKSARNKLKTLDRDVQEQLYKLLRSRRVAYLTAGHGELNSPSADEQAKGRSSKILEEILRKQNYQVRTLGLAQGLGRDVPDDAAIVFVLGPTEPFSNEALGSLERYVKRGGHLFIALDADSVESDVVGAGVTETAADEEPVDGARALTPAQAGLVALAKLVGLEYAPALLANESHHVRRRANDSDRALLISNRFSSHASVSTLSRNATRAAIIFARAGSLSPLASKGFKVDMALRAMGGTFADGNANYRFDKDSEKKETYNLAAAVTAPIEGGGKEEGKAEAAEKEKSDTESEEESKEMKAFVLSDADAMSDLLMSNFGPNRLLLMDAVRWLGGEDSYAGEINNEEDVRIEHSKQKDLVWFYGTIFGVPLLVLGAGLTLARRARRTSQVVS